MSRAAIWAAAAIFLGAPAHGQEPLFYAETGEVDGKTALSFWAIPLGEDRELEPEGIEVHLVSTDDPDLEAVFPCGQWFAPPAGQYRYWIEGGGWISPSHGLLGYSAAPFRGRGRVSIRPVVPAGLVALDPAARLGEGWELRLLHLSSHNLEDSPRPEMSRRLGADRAVIGAAMPEGPVLAALYSPASSEYVAIARPVDVRAGGLTTVGPQPPEAGTANVRSGFCSLLLAHRWPFSFCRHYPLAGGKPICSGRGHPTPS
jgi:hypothetical protein